VIILCDDLGYGDLASDGRAHKTPNLDSFASEGMRFTHYISANPVGLFSTSRPPF
jgi:arylsulfatase A